MIVRYVICAGLILIYILCCGYCSLNYVDLMRMPNMILETSAIVLQHQKVSCVDLECTHVIQCLLCLFLLVSLFLRFSPRTPKMFDCSTAHPCRNSIMRTSHVEHWDAGICMKNLTATDGQRPNLTHHTKTRLAVNRLTRSQGAVVYYQMSVMSVTPKISLTLGPRGPGGPRTLSRRGGFWAEKCPQYIQHNTVI